VFINLVIQATVEGKQNKRQYDHGKQDMGNQDKKINRSPGIACGESCFNAKGMKRNIGNKEKSRQYKCGYIQLFVDMDFLFPDHIEGYQEQQETGSIQGSIQRGQVFYESGHMLRLWQVIQHHHHQ